MLVALARVLSLRGQMYNLHDLAIGTLTQLLHKFEVRRQCEVCIQIVEAQTKLVSTGKGDTSTRRENRILFGDLSVGSYSDNLTGSCSSFSTFFFLFFFGLVIKNW